MARRFVLLWGLALGCSVPKVPSASLSGDYAVHYDEVSRRVRVTARWNGDPGFLKISRRAHVVEEEGLRRVGEGTYRPNDCRGGCTFGYSVSLDALVRACAGSLDCGVQTRGLTLVSGEGYVMVPVNPRADISVRVAPKGAAWLGFHRQGGTYRFASEGLREASFGAFGPHDVERVVGGEPSVFLVGPKGSAAMWKPLLRYLGRVHCGVSALFGRFPVEGSLFLVPIAQKRGALFGTVHAGTGASCAVLVGDDTEDFSDDWVLVHELLHFGTPTFLNEGAWLTEGLSTYYEPILRTRLGLMSKGALRAHFEREMPRGYRKAGEPAGLLDRNDIDSIYWGGALFCLLLDVRLRERGHSLDGWLRRVHEHGGNATHTWRVHDWLAAGDLPEVAKQVYDALVVRGEEPPLETLLAHPTFDAISGQTLACSEAR